VGKAKERGAGAEDSVDGVGAEERDKYLSNFHAIGKLLHAKREWPRQTGGRCDEAQARA
jgi:hypothetical protein